MPKFSAIMPCYNAEKSLGTSIQSVLEQTCEDWELICFNDGSTDATPRLLECWAKEEPRIRVIHSENRGPAVARNFAASQATGDILCFLDADDLWCSEKLEELCEVFQDQTVGGAFGEVIFCDEPGEELTRSIVPNERLSMPLLMGENVVCTMSNFSLRRELFLEHGGLAQGFVHNEDLEWLMRLTGLGVVIQPISSPHVWYRKSSGGLSSDLIAMAQSRRQALRTARFFGYEPKPADEARYLRYLARRALRLDQGAEIARSFAVAGLKQSAMAFLCPARRGVATALASLLAPVIPSALRRKFFS